MAGSLRTAKAASVVATAFPGFGESVGTARLSLVWTWLWTSVLWGCGGHRAVVGYSFAENWIGK